MEFRLNAEELNILLEVVQEEPVPAKNLLDRLIDRDLRFAFGELEDLSDALEFHLLRLQTKLSKESAEPAITEVKHKLKFWNMRSIE
jgi:hypothetical protein